MDVVETVVLSDWLVDFVDEVSTEDVLDVGTLMVLVLVKL
jgi:hypothetical protein